MLKNSLNGTILLRHSLNSANRVTYRIPCAASSKYDPSSLRGKTASSTPRTEGWLWSSLSSSKTKDQLITAGVRAKKALGQNFMVDDSILARIVQSAKISEGDLIIEIGPGTGNLTRHLLGSGARVLAVEKDNQLAGKLSESVRALGLDASGRLQLVHGDVLDLDLGKIAEEFARTGTSTEVTGEARQPGQPEGPNAEASTSGRAEGAAGRVKLVANLPYNITSDFLKEALPLGRHVSDLYLMLQDEVGDKFAKAETGSDMYRATTVRARFFSKPSYLFSIPSTAYYPQPKVTSCLVHFKLRTPEELPSIKGSPAEFMAFVNLAFISRRKMLKNNLARVYGEPEAEAALAAVGHDGRVRAERLTTDDFVMLFNHLGPHGKAGPVLAAKKEQLQWKKDKEEAEEEEEESR